MSGLFGSTLIKGNRITEFSETSATVGTVIPFGFGKFTSGGNVIWAPLPPKEQRHVKKQGKGGVKQETFTYTLSYAIAFAKGPIYGYWWIKRNGKVVWTQDPNAPIEDQEYAAKWRQRATFYNGTMDQLPDSTIESYEGSGQVSAFHHLAYIVVEDDDVTEGGGAVPTYEACVIASPPEVYLTSPPYPVAALDALGIEATYRSSAEFKPPIDYLTTSAEFISGSLPVLVSYLKYTAPVEDYLTVGAEFVSGSLPVLVGYRKYIAPAQDLLQTSAEFVSGSLPVVAGYLKYENGLPENLTTSAEFVSGTLA